MKTTDPTIKALAKRAFPDYQGRRYFREEATTVNCRSFWDEGSRDSFAFVRIDNGQVLPMPDSHPGYNRVADSVERLPIPVGAVCVRRSIHQGRECGLTVIFRQATAIEATI